MKMPPLQIKIRSLKETFDEAEKAWRAIATGEKIESSRTLSFDTVDDFRSFFTEKRLELVRVVRHRNPSSVYGLAKMLKRDLKSVRTDLRMLTLMGIVSTRKKKANTPKGYKRIPSVDFDRMILEIAV